MAWLEKVIDWLTKAQAFIAGIALAAMILLVCANIILRQIYKPISGTFELVALFGAVATAFALSFTQAKRMHIAVDLLVDRFSEHTRRWLKLINGIICSVFFALVAWQITSWSLVLIREGELTETLQIPFYPFTLAVAFGCALLSLVFLQTVLRVLFPQQTEEAS